LYPIGYNKHMEYILEQTKSFETWHLSLRDLRAKIAIARRLERAKQGNLGDVKSVGGNVSEMRINIGAGYRVYFTMRKGMIIVLLAGGNKSTQNSDIKRAIKMAQEI
jgi:putative addiction module killer protein